MLGKPKRQHLDFNSQTTKTKHKPLCHGDVLGRCVRRLADRRRPANPAWGFYDSKAEAIPTRARVRTQACQGIKPEPRQLGRPTWSYTFEHRDSMMIIIVDWYDHSLREDDQPSQRRFQLFKGRGRIFLPMLGFTTRAMPHGM